MRQPAGARLKAVSARSSAALSEPSSMPANVYPFACSPPARH